MHYNNDTTMNNHVHVEGLGTNDLCVLTLELRTPFIVNPIFSVTENIKSDCV